MGRKSQYSEAYKREAVAKAGDSGSQTAGDPGINDPYRWRGLYSNRRSCSRN